MKKLPVMQASAADALAEQTYGDVVAALPPAVLEALDATDADRAMARLIEHDAPTFSEEERAFLLDKGKTLLFAFALDEGGQPELAALMLGVSGITQADANRMIPLVERMQAIEVWAADAGRQTVCVCGKVGGKCLPVDIA